MQALERAYDEMRESEELHREALSSISDAVFLTDDEGLLLFVCPNAHVIFGYAADEVRAFGRISGLLGEDLFDPRALAARGEIRNIERRVRAKSGEKRTILVSVKTVSIRGGTVLYCCRDVTDLRHAQERLRALQGDLTQAARLTIDRAIACLTHDIKQPLTAMIRAASEGRRALPSTSARPREQELRDRLERIMAEGRLAAELIDRLCDVARERLHVPGSTSDGQAAEASGLVVNDSRRRDPLLVGLQSAAVNAPADPPGALFRQRVRSLTRRELEVFGELMEGLMNKQIAAKLGIAEKTVKIHRARIMRKMGIRSLTQLARMAERFGVPEWPPSA